MSDVDIETLSRYLDEAMSPEEAERFAARLADDAALRADHDALVLTRDLLREHTEAAQAQADFSTFFANVEARIGDEPLAAEAPARPTPAPAKGGGLRAWWQRLWAPVLLSAAAAAAIAFWVSREAPQPGPAEQVTGGAVAVDRVQNEGNKTVLISNPVDDEGATVIWLLDEEDEGEDDADPFAGEDPI